MSLLGDTQLIKSFRGYNVEQVDELLKSLEEKVTSYETEIAELKEKVKQYAAANVSISEKKEILSAKLTADKEILKEKNTALNEKVDEMTAAIAELKAKNDAYEAEIDEFKASVIHAHQAFVEAKASAEREAEGIIAAANDKSKDIIKDTDKIIDNKKMEMNRMVNKAEIESKKIYKAAEAHKVELEAENDRLSQKNVDFKAQLLDLYNSQMEAIKTLPECK